jgi:lycopene beta-cyclase
VDRQEVGVLPIPLEGRVESLLDLTPAGVPSVGVRAGLFHPTTGYSLPDAAATADALAALDPLTSEAATGPLRERALRLWRERAYFRTLNRLMFRAAEPQERYRVLEHFYGLSEALTRRFYAAELNRWDRVRILSGRPPVPVLSALRVLAQGHAGVAP